jgi:hypothetical protein
MSLLALGPIQSTMNWVLGFSPEVEQPVHEANSSPPCSVSVSTEWYDMSGPPVCPHGMHKDLTLSAL